MALLPILTAPDPRLKKKALPVAAVDADVRQLMDDMLETMYDAPGIGLAAVQVGEPVNVIVMDLAREGEEPAPRYFVNPEIVEASEEMASYEEGCLSFPKIRGDVVRPDAITVAFQDEHGVPHTLRGDGLLSRCIQHEADHLNGILFIDRMAKKVRADLDPAVRTLAKATRDAAKP